MPAAGAVTARRRRFVRRHRLAPPDSRIVPENSSFGLGFSEFYQSTQYCRGLSGSSDIANRFVKHDCCAENSIRFVRIEFNWAVAGQLA